MEVTFYIESEWDTSAGLRMYRALRQGDFDAEGVPYPSAPRSAWCDSEWQAIIALCEMIDEQAHGAEGGEGD